MGKISENIKKSPRIPSMASAIILETIFIFLYINPYPNIEKNKKKEHEKN